MEALSQQREDISKQLLRKRNDVEPRGVDRLQQEFQSDPEDLADLQNNHLEVATASTSSAFGPLHLEVPPPPLLSPPLFSQNKPVLWTDKNAMQNLSELNHIQTEPEFWKKYDCDQIISISRENARKLAAGEPDIGEKLINNFETTSRHLKFLYEAIQDGVWDTELNYLNAVEEQKNIRCSQAPLKRKSHRAQKSKVRELYQKRSNMIEQKVDILTTIVNTPFELLDGLKGNPDLDELENMY